MINGHKQVYYFWITDRQGKMQRIVVENGVAVAQIVDHNRYLLTDSEAAHYQEQLNRVLPQERN